MPHWELRKVSGGVQKALTASRNLCISTSVSRMISVFLLRPRTYATGSQYVFWNIIICQIEILTLLRLCFSDRDFNAYDFIANRLNTILSFH